MRNHDWPPEQSNPWLAGNSTFSLVLENYTYSSTPTPERDALVDIAYDCPTLEIAQERARQALR